MVSMVGRTLLLKSCWVAWVIVRILTTCYNNVNIINGCDFLSNFNFSSLSLQDVSQACIALPVPRAESWSRQYTRNNNPNLIVQILQTSPQLKWKYFLYPHIIIILCERMDIVISCHYCWHLNIYTFYICLSNNTLSRLSSIHETFILKKKDWRHRK